LASPVLLLGETGAEKEVITNAIHSLSPRSEGPFIKVNCGAIPEDLVGSELLGHEKGAFTGALSLRRGRFERANGGTIFLDEIGELASTSGRIAPGTSNTAGEEVLCLDEAMSGYILKVIALTGGRVGGDRGAARLLGIKPGTLRHRMTKLGIPFGRKPSGK
jgi:transcriptional regulator with GAF, ATPase, and Fis domain